MSSSARIERDSLGDLEVPADAYYGIHTARALTNFAVTGATIGHYPALTAALAAVKQAAAHANRDLGRLDEVRAGAIITACTEIRDGKFAEQFPVDPIQGGAGTSTNMNANEVIANRALEILGHPRGEYAALDPLAHVNLGQSTNDVYPTAVKLALVTHLRQVIAGLGRLAAAFDRKAIEFADVVKMGRTQLQDAVPMTLGQEFATYAVMLREDCDRLTEAAALLLECNLGGTAIGTGINGHPRYSALACEYLAQISGEAVVPASNLIEATQDCGVFVQVSGVLKRVAVKLSKTCNDLRLISSGPATGLGEINLPPRQAGSSIMPGKVNPVIPELVNQIAFEIIGNDLTVTMAAEAGQLQLNAFEPIIAYSLLRTTTHLRIAADTLATRCVDGITANREFLDQSVRRAPGIVTALSPYIGYAASARLAKQSLLTGESVGDIAVAEGLLTREAVEELLSPRRLAGLAVPGNPDLALPAQV
ncbi:aspartate ammonia-lyase [Nocardia pseudobrasiliensis]|uniref:Aspartate ammonia-lyase n=1 Tax=Nocardia pseudobrasiliensis TaxID=45979 RepID=A0A370HYJ1_9NOCA|nr:aspartate ammonia-lyase [Nocardia pseudobrasiliensis]RDI63538.1 aspartate ammonia-lyase [Nocardia pseudobrasiliensis]